MIDALLAAPDAPVARVVLLAVLVTALLALAVHGAVAERVERRLAQRIARARRLAGGAEAAAPAPSPAVTVRRREEAGHLGSLGRALARLVPRASVVRARLDQAGVGWAVHDFVAGCVLLGAAAFAVAFLVLGAPPPVALALALAAGAGLPTLYLRRRTRARARRFLDLFPDALDLMVRGLRAGLPIAEGLNTLGREADEPVRSLFASAAANLQIGMSLTEALGAAASRMPLPEFRFFVISVAIQQETGGNLGEILQNLSTLIRRRHQVQLKVRAMSSEARASAMIIGALPFVTAALIYLLNPDYLAKFVEDPRGWILLALGGGNLLLGVLVMAKMIRFEI